MCQAWVVGLGVRVVILSGLYHTHQDNTIVDM